MRIFLAAVLAVAASGVAADETATEAMRREIVDQKAYEACVRLYGQQIDQALIHPVCYPLFVRFGLPE